MTFTVTYRSADGAAREEAVEAANRAECFALMRTRGITPMGVKEGAPRKARKSTGRTGGTPVQGKGPHGQTPHSKGRSALVAATLLFVVVLGGGVWWLCVGGGEEPKTTIEQKITKTDIVKSAPRSETKPTAPKPTASAKAPNVDEAPKTDAKPLAGPPPGTVLSVRTNDNNLVISEVVQPDGRVKLVTTELHPPIFPNPSDQLIAAAMNASMTGQMAPMPIGPESELQFKAALKRPIEDNPDDSDEVKRMKQMVREARAQIADLMDRGQSFAQILEEHRNLWNENVKIREGVVAEYRKIVRSGDEEGARHYFNTMNTALGQMGIPPLTENDAHSKKRKTRKVEQ